MNNDATSNDQFFQWVSVSPDGQIHIVFGDRRDDPGDFLYHTYYASSSDSGVSFEPNVKVTSVASDPDINFSGTFIGDYFNVTSASIHATWTDTRNGHQDIYSSVGGACPDNDGDTICDDEDDDDDNDGCADEEELAMGFDPVAWYDFYDVPVPAVAAPDPNGPKNVAINMGRRRRGAILRAQQPQRDVW